VAYNLKLNFISNLSIIFFLLSLLSMSLPELPALMNQTLQLATIHKGRKSNIYSKNDLKLDRLQTFFIPELFMSNAV